MSTTYPTTLPTPVPEDRWGFENLPGGPSWVMMVRVKAADKSEAERRALAVVDYDYEDDLRGAVATSADVRDITSRYIVLVQLVGDEG